MKVQIREATLRDVDEIDPQTHQIAGTIFDWPAAIATDDPRVITRVAVNGDEVVGHIATGLSYGRTMIGDEHPEDLGWLKIHTLAVLPPHRDHGIASQLLQATIAALPRDAVGLYGSIIPSNTPDAIDWYRARGFLVTTLAELWNPRLSRGARLLTEPDQAYFYSDIHTLRYWSGKHATEQSELARLRKSVDQEMKLREKAGRFSRSIGYRAFADHAIAVSTGSCPHAARPNAIPPPRVGPGANHRLRRLLLRPPRGDQAVRRREPVRRMWPSHPRRPRRNGCA